MSFIHARVSVVIPTYRRHDEVIRAVRSVLTQTVAPLEVLVVNDGPDAEKGALIAELGDPRVQYHEAPRRGIASATRNAGIALARADWVALLDDDDIWLPNKLQAQFDALKRAGLNEAILAGQEAVFEEGRHLHNRPHREVPHDIAADELLFCGFGGVNTSTLLAPTRVFRAHPLDESLERHEDWSWLLVAGQSLPMVVANEVVCERHIRRGEGLSRPGGSAFSRAWYEKHRSLMSPKARSAFLTRILSRKAAYDGKLAMIPWLMGETWRNTGVYPTAYARMMRPWVVPQRLRRWGRVMMTRR